MTRRRRPHAARAVLLTLAAAGAALLLGSCSVARSYVEVIQGTYAYRRGSYQEATVHYLAAQKNRTDAGRVAYDLGNVYHALGEPEGAQAEWGQADKSKDPTVITATLFNEGVLDYELGHYREAYDHFRKVLEMNPEDIEAKIDLELSFEKMTTREVPPSGASPQPVAIRHTNQQEHQLLDIIRRDQKGYFTPPPPVKNPPKVANW